MASTVQTTNPSSSATSTDTIPSIDQVTKETKVEDLFPSIPNIAIPSKQLIPTLGTLPSLPVHDTQTCDTSSITDLPSVPTPAITNSETSFTTTTTTTAIIPTTTSSSSSSSSSPPSPSPSPSLPASNSLSPVSFSIPLFTTPSSSSSSSTTSSSSKPTLNICSSCRPLLLSIYDHCIHPSSTTSLPSPYHHHHVNHHHVDSVGFLNPILLPSLPPSTSKPPPNPLTSLHLPSPQTLMTPIVTFEDPHQQIATDRAMTKLRQLDHTYKHHPHYQHLLTKVRAQLHTKQQEEQMYKTQNHHLRESLKECLEFCTHIEEWKLKETEQLVLAIQGLKEQVSSLMGMYIHLEEEKHKLKDEKKALETQLQERDKLIHKGEQEVDVLKEKLHQFYKEYKTMHDRAQVLELEVNSGSSLLQSKADHLGKQLDKLSMEFEKTSQQLTLSQERSRQLEFELSLVISQFNETGDERKLLKEELNDVTNQFSVLESKHTQLITKHEETLVNVNQFQNQLYQERTEYTRYRTETSEKITELQTQCEQLQKLKMHLEEIVARLKSETEKLRTSMIDMRSLHTELETNYSKLQVQTQMDQKEWSRKSAQQKEDIARLQEEAQKASVLKEKMLGQLNDYRGMLERERSRASQLDTDLRSIRKTAAQEKWDLEEQIQTLLHAKKNLVMERKELASNLDATKEELLSLQSKYVEMETNLEEYTQTKENEVTGLEANVHSLSEALTKLTSQHGQLTYNYRTVQAQIKEMEEDKKGLESQLHQREQELKATHTINMGLQKEKVELNTKYEDLKQLSQEQEEKIAAQIHLNKELKILSQQREGEFKQSQLQSEERFSDLTDRFHQLKEQYQGLQLAYDQSIKNHNHTKRELLQTQEHLMEEAASRSILELSIDELRSRYFYERRNRMDLMRIQEGIQRKSMEWKTENTEFWSNRENTWEKMESWLNNQLRRLNKLVDVIESDSFNLPYNSSFVLPGFSSSLNSSLTAKEIPTSTITSITTTSFSSTTEKKS